MGERLDNIEQTIKTDGSGNLYLADDGSYKEVITDLSEYIKTEDADNTYATINSIKGKQDASLKFTDVAAAVWVEDPTYEEYPYRCDIACEGVTDDMYAEISFGLEKAISSDYAPICETNTNVVSIWSKVNTEITVPTIIVTSLTGVYSPNGTEPASVKEVAVCNEEPTSNDVMIWVDTTISEDSTDTNSGTLKYRNPNYVEGGSEPKWITLGAASSDSSGGSGDNGSGDTGGDNGGGGTGGDTTQYEKVNVSISASNGSSITANVTVNGETKSVTSGSSVMWEVPYGTEYTIVSDSVDGYSNPESMTFTAEQEIRNVELVYNKIAVSYITINQNITDSATMINGDIKGEAIQMIRANSHRYLGKYTADNTMTVCQLDDADSNYYSNGSKAYLDGKEGDVFMKLPKFWWKCYEEEEGSNVWTIGFAYGAAPDDTWKEWAGDELIGTFFSGDKNGNPSAKAVSVSSGFQSKKYTAYNVFVISNNSVLSKTESRGVGYGLTKLKHHNILRLLFLAYYGNTDSQSVLGNGSYGTGSTSQPVDTGMSDTIASMEDNQYVAFWGLCGVITSDVGEIISNAIFSSNTSIMITEDDGVSREISIPSGQTYATKLTFGEYGDCIIKEGGGSSSTGYCDNVYNVSTENGWGLTLGYSNGRGLFAIKSVTPDSSNTGDLCFVRLVFKGTIIEETDVEAFRLIEITN